ncbi:MAG: transglycosylase family protein [Acidimicrobiales bacterium]
MAGHPHRSAVLAEGEVAPAVTPSVDLESTEVPPAARVHRSRLAFALAVTLAALPILVLDNFPATADTPAPVEASAALTTEAAPSTTEAPTTTAAPTTTLASTITEAPTTSTTVAPSTTTTKAPVRTTVAVAKPTPTTAPPTTQAPAPSGVNGDPNDPATWDRMARCEAGGNWAANTGNGYYGGLQFSLGTWQHYGGSGYPHQASKATQIEIGKRLQAAEGWAAWPSCSRELGYT